MTRKADCLGVETAGWGMGITRFQVIRSTDNTDNTDSAHIDLSGIRAIRVIRGYIKQAHLPEPQCLSQAAPTYHS